MSAKANYTLVGLFVVIFVFIAVLLFFWLHYKGGRTSYNTYVMYVHDDVTGLSVQSPVRYTGVPVGFVETVTLDDHNPQLVKIILKIKSGTPVLTTTVATLSVQGITGSAYVALSANSDNAPLLKAKSGQTYPVIQSRPSLLNKLTTALPEVADNLQELSGRINKLLDTSNVSALSEMIQNLKNFSASLSQSSPDLSNIVDSVNVAMKNAAKSSEDLPKLVQQSNKAMSDLTKTINQINKTTHTFNDALDSADVLITNTTQQLLPSASSLVAQLNQLTIGLQKFTSELSRNPSILIRGKQPAIPGPGESR